MSNATGGSHDAAALKRRCLEIIDGFHHREALRADDIRQWVDHVVGAHGNAAPWHAARAAGFGGSDIGVLVRNWSNLRADHQASAHDIVEGKLLRAVPSEETGDLRRGHENEPRHAEAFYRKYAAVRDEGAFTRLSAAHGVRLWMRYSPDDVVLVPTATPNPSLGGALLRRVLVDYKAPRRVDPDPEIAFQYACQLHQGAMVCARSGIHLDGLMLSQFDWAAWELKDDNVVYDQELARMILRAGDHYHAYVLRGELPPYIMTPRFEREDEFVKEYGQKAQLLAQLRAASKALGEEQELLETELKSALSKTWLAGTKMSLGDLKVTAVTLVDHEAMGKLLGLAETAALRKRGTKPDYDGAAMAERLKELGEDPARYRIDKIDPEIGYLRLLELGHDPERFMTQQIRFKVSAHLEQAARDMVRVTYPRLPEKDSQASGEDAYEGPQDAADDQQDVREGESNERLAPRTVMA